MSQTGVNNSKQTLERLPRALGLAYLVVFIAEFLVIIIGNAIAIAVFLRTWQLRRNKCYWLCINLAVSDLLVGLINGPLWLFDLASRCDFSTYTWNDTAFKAMETVFLFIFYGSLINLTLISLERMFATLWTAKHRLLEARNYHVLIGVGWILSTFHPSFNIAIRYQQISSHTFSYVWILSNCFLLLIIFASYVSIGVKFKFYRNPRRHATSAQDRRLTKNLFLVTVVSVMTWLPGVVLTTPIAAHAVISYSSTHVFNHAINLVGLLNFANSMANPIIYSFKVPRFRQLAFRFLRRREAETRMHGIEMRNRAELNRQDCAVISHRSVPNVEVDKLSEDTELTPSLDLHVQNKILTRKTILAGINVRTRHI